MVVEDNSLLRTSLSDALSGGDIDVVASCATASEAVEELRRVKIDVLVTDLRSAPIDGYEFLRRLRAVPEYRAMAIVVATALDEADLQARGGLPPGTVRYGVPLPLDTLRGFVEACAVRRRLAAPR